MKDFGDIILRVGRDKYDERLKRLENQELALRKAIEVCKEVMKASNDHGDYSQACSDCIAQIELLIGLSIEKEDSSI